MNNQKNERLKNIKKVKILDNIEVAIFCILFIVFAINLLAGMIMFIAIIMLVIIYRKKISKIFKNNSKYAIDVAFDGYNEEDNIDEDIVDEISSKLNILTTTDDAIVPYINPVVLKNTFRLEKRK